MSNKYILKRAVFCLKGKNHQSSDTDNKGFYFHKSKNGIKLLNNGFIYLYNSRDKKDLNRSVVVH